MGFFKDFFTSLKQEQQRQAEVKARRFPVYEDYKAAHKEIILIDQHGNKFTLPWKAPFVVTVVEVLDEETSRRFQFFVTRIKQNSIRDYFFTGYSFSSKTERSLTLEGVEEDCPITYKNQTFSPKRFFYFLKEQILNQEADKPKKRYH